MDCPIDLKDKSVSKFKMFSVQYHNLTTRWHLVTTKGNLRKMQNVFIFDATLAVMTVIMS